MSICVVNYSNPVNTQIEYDEYVDYRDGIFWNGNKLIKKCISWHSLAAALQTEFFVVGKPNFNSCLKYDTIVLLVHRDLDKVIPFVDKLKLMKKKVLIAFHENLDTFSNLSMNLTWLKDFIILCNKCDVFLNMSSKYSDFFEELLKIRVEVIPHAVPWEWPHGLTKPIEEREGIIIGTRTFSQVLKRNTLISLVLCNSLAKENNTFATLLTEDGIPQEYFKTIGLDHIRVENGPLSYEKWLELISRHKIMVHFDNSNTLGQVVMDAGLVDVICFGGNTQNNILIGTQCDDYWILKALCRTPHPGVIDDLKTLTSFSAVKDHIMKIIEDI